MTLKELIQELQKLSPEHDDVQVGVARNQFLSSRPNIMVRRTVERHGGYFTVGDHETDIQLRVLVL